MSHIQKSQEGLELVELDNRIARFAAPNSHQDWLEGRGTYQITIDWRRWDQIGRPVRITVTVEKL